jgi:hypothetical protein
MERCYTRDGEGGASSPRRCAFWGPERNSRAAGRRWRAPCPSFPSTRAGPALEDQRGQRAGADETRVRLVVF